MVCPVVVNNTLPRYRQPRSFSVSTSLLRDIDLQDQAPSDCPNAAFHGKLGAMPRTLAGNWMEGPL